MSHSSIQSGEQLLIAGAGVAGLYCAWRLIRAGHPAAKLRIVEATDRVGGRLWSDPLRAADSLPAELGGMFFNDQQPLVYGLCRDVFDLARAPVTPVPDFAWLRATRMTIKQFADPAVLPYRLRPDEQGLSYDALTLLAIERIAPDLKQHWPMNPNGTRADSLIYLQNLRFEGRLIADWGFWNLLARVISNEAWQALRDVVSSYTLFGNWNGFDAIVSIVLEQAGTWYRLVHGYQQLPEALARDLRQVGVEITLGQTLTRIERRSAGGLSLTLDQAGIQQHRQADRLILALPRFPIARLVQASPDLQGGSLEALLSAIDSVPACKIFLTFERPWWREVPDGPGQIKNDTYGVSHTDLPMRQCYYLGMDPDDGRGLMMASYGDGTAVEFWRALGPDSGRGQALKTELGQRARREIRRQLSDMHGVDVPEPLEGVFINWSQPPFGGAWHNWLPGWRSWQCARKILHPDPDWPIHVCGEAWSEAQGWTEGALRSAEQLLQTRFGLTAPSWTAHNADPAERPPR